MTTKEVGCALGVCLVWMAAPGVADIYTNGDGLGVTPFITFDEFGQGPKDGTEWQPWGVTFSALNMETDNYDGFPGIDGVNLYALADPKLRIEFDRPMSAFAMAWVTHPGTTTFTTYLGDSVVEQAVVPTALGDPSISYSVFENMSFDAIEATIDASHSDFRMDNLQIPEPGTLLPLMLGLAAMIGSRRRAA